MFNDKFTDGFIDKIVLYDKNIIKCVIFETIKCYLVLNIPNTVIITDVSDIPDRRFSKVTELNKDYQILEHIKTQHDDFVAFYNASKPQIMEIHSTGLRKWNLCEDNLGPPRLIMYHNIGYYYISQNYIYHDYFGCVSLQSMVQHPSYIKLHGYNTVFEDYLDYYIENFRAMFSLIKKCSKNRIFFTPVSPFTII